MMEGTVVEKKGWFVLVRSSRENVKDSRTEDEFSDPKYKLCLWVSL